jgi:hypothetical protein
MKLCGSTFMFLGAIYVFSRLVLLGISIFLYCVRVISAQLQEWREEQGTTTKHCWQQFPALPYAPSVEPRIHIYDQHTNFQLENYGWKQLILVVNLLFGLRVNEIPNKTFILDSHRPFICSV